jgi:cell division septation protein DedD
VSEEGFHEIQLSGKQLVFLGMATTGVLVAVFLIGVVVGRGAGPETVIADATGTTLEAAEPGPAPAPDAGPPSAEPPAPVPEEPDELSYHERLQQSQPAAEKLQTAPAPAPAAASPPEAPETAATGWVAQIGAYRERATADKMAASLKADNFPAFVLAPAPGSPTTTFRVRVGPYKERRDAEAIAGRLKRERQFDAHVTR